MISRCQTQESVHVAGRMAASRLRAGGPCVKSDTHGHSLRARSASRVCAQTTNSEVSAGVPKNHSYPRNGPPTQALPRQAEKRGFVLEPPAGNRKQDALGRAVPNLFLAEAELSDRSPVRASLPDLDDGTRTANPGESERVDEHPTRTGSSGGKFDLSRGAHQFLRVAIHVYS